ncbi:hypothetical protein DMA12_19120 [Amycolatopsis balhimycina DSM 5908]|uniref:Uncharacterized protein n=1 Tax=Amycolatopsis balhimycina DSM 5908 TaxID=1081091 RepID=A0A428WJV3_AMYBA|nr:hypothetical protein [Amycolatopsis balhimycina]RSM43365.1 hypothetical protein DMA12_19120 [Amycolatopsis balhimycina DSM 5908]
MSAGLPELAVVIIAVGSIVRPVCKWLTAKTLVSKARPEDIPEIAKALHPPLEIKRKEQP